MVDFIVTMVERAGVAGIFLLMLVENLFPPIPSELIMPLAGFVASRGQMSLPAVIIAGTAGSLLGTLFWYVIGRWFGESRLKGFAARHGRWLTMSPDEIDRAHAWFIRRGVIALVLGRLVPGVRTLISVPAGVFHVPLSKFLLLSSLGTGLWTAALAYAGFAFGENYGAVANAVEPVSTGILVVAILVYIYRVVTFRSGAARPSSTDKG